MERYVIDMDDEGGHIYYLTEDKDLFKQAKDCEDDQDLWNLLANEEHRFERVYSLTGITVLGIISGYFY